jgi:hypothetical protein
MKMANEDSKLAAVLIELMDRFSKLPLADSPVMALEMLQKQEQKVVEAQFERMLETKFRWWQWLRSPFHSMSFYRVRKQCSRDAKRIARSDWVELKTLLIRIRFGFRLDFRSADLLEKLIREKIVTERDAWRLLHSPGCTISKNRLEPSPLPPVAGFIGMSISILLGLLAVLLLQPLIMSIFGECKSPICQVIGNAVIASWLLQFGYFSAACTWGRRDAANVLSKLLTLEFEPVETGRFALKRPLISKLLW